MTRLTMVVAGGLGLFLAVVTAIRPNAFGTGPVVNVYDAAELACLAAVLFGIWRWHPPQLAAWLLIAATIALWTIGDVVYALLGTNPTLSLADGFYMMGYVTAILGLLQLVRAHTRQRNWDTFIDMALVSVASLYAAWELVVRQVWSVSESSGLGHYVVASYPVLDAVLLVLIAALLFDRRGRPTTSHVFLAIGTLVVLVGDTYFAIIQQANGAVGNLLNASWPLGYALIALAAVHPSVASAPAPAQDLKVFRTPKVSGAVFALLALPVTTAVAEQIDRRFEVVPLLIASALVVVLVGWRFVRLQHEALDAVRGLDSSQRYFRALALNSSDAYVVISGDGFVTDVSPEVQRVVGWTADRLKHGVVAAHITELIHPDDQTIAIGLLHRVREHGYGEALSGEVRVRRPDNSFEWVEGTVTNLLGNPDVSGVVLNIHNIDVRKQAEQRLYYQAFHDTLTGLANRALLYDRIDQGLARMQRGGGGVALLFCDLDGFKTVNDTLGHAAGDELLRAAARRLAKVGRQSDTVARLGGDEFALVLEGGRELSSHAETFAARMLQALSDPVEIAGTSMVMTASIGVAVTQSDGNSVVKEDLLRQADIAMYHAKMTGRNRVAKYDSSMGSGAVNWLSLTQELNNALERDEFLLYYQPIMDLENNLLMGFEALIRWQHPTRGLIAPVEFIPIAELSDVIIEIGRWVLRQACVAAAEWPSVDSLPPLSVSVNVAARHLDSDSLLIDIEDALTASGLDPRRLIVELTESALVHQPDAVARRLQMVKKLGVRVAIDDFGTGYSSLSYLRRFPIDILKIDKSFVDTIDDGSNLPAIIRGLVDLSRRLDLVTVAEGIERPEQRSSLVGEGCALGQGYLFSKPVPRVEAMAMAMTRTSDSLALSHG